MKMPCEKNNQQPKCCHTQRTQELDCHNRKSQPPPSLLFLTASLCLRSWGESSVYLAVLSDPCGLCQGTLPWSGSHSTSAAFSVDVATPACLGQVWVTLVMTLVPATVSSGVRPLYSDLSYSELRHFLAYGPFSAPHLPYKKP